MKGSAPERGCACRACSWPTFLHMHVRCWSAIAHARHASPASGAPQSFSAPPPAAARTRPCPCSCPFGMGWRSPSFLPRRTSPNTGSSCRPAAWCVRRRGLLCFCVVAGACASWGGRGPRAANERCPPIRPTPSFPSPSPPPFLPCSQFGAGYVLSRLSVLRTAGSKELREERCRMLALLGHLLKLQARLHVTACFAAHRQLLGRDKLSCLLGGCRVSLSVQACGAMPLISPRALAPRSAGAQVGRAEERRGRAGGAG